MWLRKKAHAFADFQGRNKRGRGQLDRQIDTGRRRAEPEEVQITGTAVGGAILD